MVFFTTLFFVFLLVFIASTWFSLKQFQIVHSKQDELATKLEMLKTQITNYHKELKEVKSPKQPPIVPTLAITPAQKTYMSVPKRTRSTSISPRRHRARTDSDSAFLLATSSRDSKTKKERRKDRSISDNHIQTESLPDLTIEEMREQLANQHPEAKPVSISDSDEIGAQEPTEIKQFDIINLAHHLSKSISVEDRRYRLKLYKNCFIGRQAIAYLVGLLNTSRTEAIAIMQSMLNENLIACVNDNTKTFHDDFTFYRFGFQETPSFKLNKDLQVHHIESPCGEGIGDMEGWLEMITLGFAHRKFFRLVDECLFFYDKPPNEGGKELGHMNLEGCVVNDVKASSYRFQIMSLLNRDIVTVNDLTQLPAMTVLSKLRGSSIWLQACGPTKVVDFADWLIILEQLGLLNVCILVCNNLYN